MRQSVQDLIIGRRDTYNIGSERMVRTPLATPNCAYVRSAVSTPGDRLRVSWLIACAIMAVIVATAGHWKHSGECCHPEDLCCSKWLSYSLMAV